MSIQSNINQQLSLIGALTAMNPTLRGKAEERAQLSNLNKRESILRRKLDVAHAKGKTIPGIEEEFRQVAEQKFDISPSEETYREYEMYHQPTFKTEPPTAEEIRAGDVDDIIQEALEEEGRQAAFEERKSKFRQAATAAAEAELKQEQDRLRRSNFLAQIMQGVPESYNVREVIKYEEK